MTVRHIAMWILGLGLVSAASGCAVSHAIFGTFGPPDGSRLVGGGESIEFEAPEDGTVYLVEKQTSKIIETRSLKEGDSYSFSVASGAQAQDFETVLGIDFSEARFLLYFKPDGRQR